MIITLVKADFSQNKVGQLNSWFISAPTVSGGVVTADANNPSSINKESKPAVTLKYTFDTTKYEYVSCTPSVGTASCSGNTITVSIPEGATIVANVTISIVLNRISGGEEEEKYTITYQYMCNGSSIKTATTEQVTAGTSRTFATTDSRAQISGYTCTSVSPSGNQIINGNITVTYNYTANAVEPPAGGSEALDLNTLTLAHCSSAKLGAGDKENLIYDQTTHELKVHSTGWYKVSYFEQPVTVGTEIEFVTNYGKSQTGNFIGIYEQTDLVDGVAEEKSSFWPAPSKFGVYAPGQGGNDFIYIWDKKNSKTKTADGLEGDYFNGKTIKLKLLATGTEVYVDGVKLTWASGATAATLTAGVNYYVGFHNSTSTSTPADTGIAQTITYIGPIR